jgi:hypothetical protein
MFNVDRKSIKYSFHENITQPTLHSNFTNTQEDYMTIEKKVKATQTLGNLVNYVCTKHPETAEYITNSASIKGMNTLIGSFQNWASRNFAPPSPHFVKQAVLIRNAFTNATWIETGTFLGETTELLSRHGSFVYSIEPEPTLYTNASERFKSHTNVKILNGISEVVFPTLLPKISGDVNFWLDGHYSEGITFKGPQDTPILDELMHISQNLSNFNQISVMIDDARCFNPNSSAYSSYPPLRSLVDWAEGNDLDWHIEHDIFIAKTKAV